MGITILALAVILIFDFRPICRNKKGKEIWSYAVLLTIAAATLLLHEVGVKLPSIHMQMTKLINMMMQK